MTNLLSSFVAAIRFVFVLAVAALIVLSIGSLVIGVGATYAVLKGGPAGLPPQDFLAGPVPHFIRAAFLYFLATAFCSLFVGDLPVPHWMTVRNLFNLRTKVLTFLSLILPLLFLGKVAHGGIKPIESLYLGGGVFLVLAALYLFLRHGSPSGDDALSREGNRPPHGKPSEGGRPREDRPREDRQRDDRKSGRQEGGAAGGGDWLEKQKENLKFEKNSILSSERPPGEGEKVTVRPGPRRPFRRRPR